MHFHDFAFVFMGTCVFMGTRTDFHGFFMVFHGFQRALMIFDHALRDLLHVFTRRRARRAARRQLCSQRERRKAPIRRAAAAYADDDCCRFWAKSPERASESEARVAVSTIFTQLFA